VPPNVNLTKAIVAVQSGILMLLLGVQVSLIAAPLQNVTTLLQNLDAQGVSIEAIRGVDSDGIPIVCGTGLERSDVSAAKPPPPPPSPPTGELPSGIRSWECVPSVIRSDGVDTFRVEVDVNGSVAAVFLQNGGGRVQFVSGASTESMRDDGLLGDRKAGDNVFTSSLLCYNTNIPMLEFLYFETNSPKGLSFESAGQVSVVETNGITNRFLIPPAVGVLSKTIPTVETVFLASNILSSDHLINIQSTNRETQRSFRWVNNLQNLTKPIYAVLPDAFDFFNFFSIDHLEYVDIGFWSENVIAGLHHTVQVKYTGTGMPLVNNSVYFGSAGRLLGLNMMDSCGRGVYTLNATHELVHQWASYTSVGLGISQSGGHYIQGCSANSAVGGQNWINNGNGTFTKDCNSRHTNAAAIDKYMMGLIAGSNLPPIVINTNSIACSSNFTPTRTVTVSEIQSVHGVRTPTPENAQKDFKIAFVAETYRRQMNATEMTFYEILADVYTAPIPSEKPSPPIGYNWVSIDRYFGEGSKWSSGVLDVIRPRITATERLTNAATRILGTGYPGRNYRLLKSTNFVNWSAVTNKVAATNGIFLLMDSLTTSNSCFYRVATP
jgi:hypothetical protein